MNRIPVAMFPDPAAAEPVRQRLATAGLDATINDQPRLSKLWFVARHRAGARVEVPADQLETGVDLLISWDSEEGGLRNAIRCPECHSFRIDYPQYARHSLLTNLAMGFLSELRIIDREYYCEHCHYTWPKDGVGVRRDRSRMSPLYFIEGVKPNGNDARRSPTPPSEEHRKAA